MPFDKVKEVNKLTLQVCIIWYSGCASICTCVSHGQRGLPHAWLMLGNCLIMIPRSVMYVLDVGRRAFVACCCLCNISW